jgi:hypothetical protein
MCQVCSCLARNCCLALRFPNFPSSDNIFVGRAPYLVTLETLEHIFAAQKTCASSRLAVLVEDVPLIGLSLKSSPMYCSAMIRFILYLACKAVYTPLLGVNWAVTLAFGVQSDQGAQHCVLETCPYIKPIRLDYHETSAVESPVDEFWILQSDHHSNLVLLFCISRSVG